MKPSSALPLSGFLYNQSGKVKIQQLTTFFQTGLYKLINNI
jgi:hypothetical protein